MKEKKHKIKKNIIKNLFIKVCRILGYEIIDQNNFFVPTQNKFLNENLSSQGNKSINLPLGEVKISRKVSSLTVIFRSCTNVNMLTQNKKRLFEENKSEYTFRSLNSIIKSLRESKISFPNINFEIIVVDHKSKDNDVNKIKSQLMNSKIKNSFISLNVNDFISGIKKVNAKNEKVSENQISNMSNIHKSLQIAINQAQDLVYFVEDDYLHELNAFDEMISSYERISSQVGEELILCPADYPYLYTQTDPTSIFLGASKHWRRVDESLCTFLTSKKIISKYWKIFTSMCEYEHYPFEKPLHDIYKNEYCLSPIPSIALHCTNVNSIFGLSPNVDWKKMWEESKIA